LRHNFKKALRSAHSASIAKSKIPNPLDWGFLTYVWFFKVRGEKEFVDWDDTVPKKSFRTEKGNIATIHPKMLTFYAFSGTMPAIRNTITNESWMCDVGGKSCTAPYMTTEKPSFS
jgi:hypothetical protein